MDKTQVKKIKAILARHKIRKAAVFGSFARGETRKGSDIDILIAPPAKTTLFDLAGIKGELETSLKREVDLITFDSVDRLLAPYINKDIKMII